MSVKQFDSSCVSLVDALAVAARLRKHRRQFLHANLAIKRVRGRTVRSGSLDAGWREILVSGFTD